MKTEEELKLDAEARLRQLRARQKWMKTITNGLLLGMAVATLILIYIVWLAR